MAVACTVLTSGFTGRPELPLQHFRQFEMIQNEKLPQMIETQTEVCRPVFTAASLPVTRRGKHPSARPVNAWAARGPPRNGIVFGLEKEGHADSHCRVDGPEDMLARSARHTRTHCLPPLLRGWGVSFSEWSRGWGRLGWGECLMGTEPQGGKMGSSGDGGGSAAQQRE